MIQVLIVPPQSQNEKLLVVLYLHRHQFTLSIISIQPSHVGSSSVQFIDVPSNVHRLSGFNSQSLALLHIRLFQFFTQMYSPLQYAIAPLVVLPQFDSVIFLSPVPFRKNSRSFDHCMIVILPFPGVLQFQVGRFVLSQYNVLVSLNR